ncbi:hypothetical protein C0J52_14105, partial [Blattella germanica]
INKLGLCIESRSYSVVLTCSVIFEASSWRSKVYSQNHRPMQKDVRNTFVKCLI